MKAAEAPKRPRGSAARDQRAKPWVRTLAEPYLRGLNAVRESGGSLDGYWFIHPSSKSIRSPLKSRSARRVSAVPEVGFFVGYVVSESGFEFISPQAPECVVFAFVRPAGGELHAKVVGETSSLIRTTVAYIRFLTHRPPRFVLHVDREAVMIRHQSMLEWPREKYDHFSKNFFIETLAWLVRSALVRRFLALDLSVGKELHASTQAPQEAGSRSKA